jgi:hypothetical protein
MELVGHKTEAIYKRYSIVNAEDRRKAAARLAAQAAEPKTQPGSSTVTAIR